MKIYTFYDENGKVIATINANYHFDAVDMAEDMGLKKIDFATDFTTETIDETDHRVCTQPCDCADCQN